jgi:hypothetical protein
VALGCGGAGRGLDLWWTSDALVCVVWAAARVGPDLGPQVMAVAHARIDWMWATTTLGRQRQDRANVSHSSVLALSGGVAGRRASRVFDRDFSIHSTAVDIPAACLLLDLSAGGVGTTSVALSKGSNSRQDVICRMRVPGSGWSVMFRKASPANFIGKFMPGDCWIGCDLIVHTLFFSGHLISERALRSSAGCYHRGAYFLVPW